VRRGRGAVIFLVVVGLWFLSVVWFALRPDSQTVVVGKDAKGADVTRTVNCHSPLSSSAGPSALPDLPAPLTYPTNPCPERHRQDRRLVAVDTVVFLALVGGGVWALRRARRPDDDDEATAVAGASVSSPRRGHA
jgi:cbb3-type cytochrome oxidase subunit 3